MSRPLDPKLTGRQRQVLQLLISHLLGTQLHMPIRGIGKALGIGSTNGVQDHLNALERKGFIHTGKPGCSGRKILRWPDGQPFVLTAVSSREDALAEVLFNPNYVIQPAGEDRPQPERGQ